MLRYEKIEDISDGKLYGEDDEVCVGTNGCKGCSYCCKSDMGKSIVLTPYDMYELNLVTGKSFDELLVEFVIELSMIDGIVMPHLKMDGGCKFLKDDRCSIHLHRPGICRLFPLGRLYNESGFDYIVQTDQCQIKERTPVKVSDWLGIDELGKNTEFINKWHRFVKFERKKVSSIREMAGHEARRIREMAVEDLEVYAGIIGEQEDFEEKGAESYRSEKIEEINETSEATIKEVMKRCISILYLDKYDTTSDFYEQFDKRLRRTISEIRGMN